MGRRHFTGNVGLTTAEDQIPRALGTCIDAIRKLPAPARTRVLRGLQAWLVEDATSIDWEER